VRPNMRVQRTRSSPSAPRSPLTRHPLAGRISLHSSGGQVVGTGSSDSSPTVTSEENEWTT